MGSPFKGDEQGYDRIEAYFSTWRDNYFLVKQVNREDA